jgi:outer membrane protein TolC
MSKNDYSRFIRAVFLIGALHLALPSWANPLALTDAQRHALERSRQLDAQDAAASALHELSIAAAQRSDPVLKFGVENLPINGADDFSLTRDFMTMRRIGVMQEVTRADKRQLNSERYQREAEKLLANRNITIAAIERDTALAWLDRYYMEAMGSVIAGQIQQARLEIEAVESGYRSGRASQADVYAAKIMLVIIEDRASEIDQRVRAAEIMLARWVGFTSETLADIPDMQTIRLQRPMLDIHLQNHPEITALTKQAEIAATEASLAQANKRPDWSWDVAYQQRGPAYSDMLSLGVSIPLQWDRQNRQGREVTAKLARVDEARAVRDEMLRTHIAEVSTMIDEWENGRERRARYQRELLPLAKARVEAILAGYRGGKSSLVDVLAAQRNETETRLQALQLDLAIARLWAQINFIVPNNTVPVDTNPSSTLVGK